MIWLKELLHVIQTFGKVLALKTNVLGVGCTSTSRVDSRIVEAPMTMSLELVFLVSAAKGGTDCQAT